MYVPAKTIILFNIAEELAKNIEIAKISHFSSLTCFNIFLLKHSSKKSKLGKQ
jgi:hypothetical protein